MKLVRCSEVRACSGFVRCLFAVACAFGASSATDFQLGFGRASAQQTAPDGSAARVVAQQANSGEHPYSVRFPVPSLDGGEWVNTTEPISLDSLRGRFVLLDFWTYCCINCMHVLPELKKLEHAYPNELVVIGVHSAKFAGEQATENIREAALRYEIEHPIINDARMVIWQRYGARSWPTLVLIDPAGEVVWAASGERTFEQIKQVIDRGLPYYRQQGLLKPAPRIAVVGSEKLPQTPLRFPGKVLADEASGRLFISDSNHNRIVVVTLDGKLLNTIGSGAIGNADGAYGACSFNHPQGMALVGNTLYVADTENHMLRKVDLEKQQVTTVAGTGAKADYGFKRATKLKETPLASPWAVYPHGDNLLIAMAGPHQIWTMKLDESELRVYAGDGREDIVDGRLRQASFAQPSGLASDGERLFVADSEGSTIRSVPLRPSGGVQTIVGLTGTLFDFGDVDGVGDAVRLQHPLDVAWSNGSLYVADTYNNKVKQIDVVKQSCQTIAGTGAPGDQDSAEGIQATFNEPGGISAAGGKLYIADTNNHAIRVMDLAAPHEVTTLQTNGLAAPAKR